MAEEDERLQSDREGHALDASAPSTEGLDESTPETGEPKRGIEWREILRQAFKKAQQAQQPVASRRELGKDRSKSLMVLVGAVVVVLLFFLAIFSSPRRVRKADETGRPGTPDLGRRMAPGQENAEPGKSVTPMLSADVAQGQAPPNGTLTAEDIDRTSRTGQRRAPIVATPKKNEYALNRVDFSDPALRQQPGYGVGPAYQREAVPAPSQSDDLRKPSLVFVRSGQRNLAAAGLPTAVTDQAEESQVFATLPPGTRLVARLEAPASTAVKEPVIAVIEYNYERDGEIVVPAGARAVGDVRQADNSGNVDIKFHTLELPDGRTEQLNGAAMDLTFGPLKGRVAGKKTGTRFLVRAFTGLGTVAAYVVGNPGGTGFSGPISESALLRERIANNIGVAGDQQLNELAFNQHIVVTVPGNTRFYIVLENGAFEKDTAGGRRTVTPVSTATRSGGLPSLEELRQLMQLKQELSAMYDQAGTRAVAAESTPQP
jgi:Bacterial conjugation TrbI-like protein